MEKKREIYEKRSEILTKKLLSKIYALEANYLESRMNAGKSMNEVTEKVSDWEKKLKDLSNEREKLNQLYQNMVNASKDKWEETSAAFETYAEKVNAEKQNFYERTQGWMNDMGAWINDLEGRARESSGQLREQLMNQVEHLKNEQDNLRKKARELQKTTGENWEKLTTNINNEVKALRTSITNAYQHFFPSDKGEKGTSET
jgi:DNA-binding ferritin-like protein